MLWDLNDLLAPIEGLQQVTINGLNYMLLIRESFVFHATRNGFGYRGYKALQNEKSKYSNAIFYLVKIA